VHLPVMVLLPVLVLIIGQCCCRMIHEAHKL
jgi:hypothetical protein